MSKELRTVEDLIEEAINHKTAQESKLAVLGRIEELALALAKLRVPRRIGILVSEIAVDVAQLRLDEEYYENRISEAREALKVHQ